MVLSNSKAASAFLILCCPDFRKAMAADPQVYRFISEIQIGIHISLMRDVMSPSSTLNQINVAYPEADDSNLPVNQIGCPLSFARPTNLIIFPPRWLDQAANRAPRFQARSTCVRIISTASRRTASMMRNGAAGAIKAGVTELRPLGTFAT